MNLVIDISDACSQIPLLQNAKNSSVQSKAYSVRPDLLAAYRPTFASDVAQTYLLCKYDTPTELVITWKSPCACHNTCASIHWQVHAGNMDQLLMSEHSIAITSCEIFDMFWYMGCMWLPWLHVVTLTACDCPGCMWLFWYTQLQQRI